MTVFALQVFYSPFGVRMCERAYLGQGQIKSRHAVRAVWMWMWWWWWWWTGIGGRWRGCGGAVVVVVVAGVVVVVGGVGGNLL